MNGMPLQLACKLAFTGLTRIEQTFYSAAMIRIREGMKNESGTNQSIINAQCDAVLYKITKTRYQQCQQQQSVVSTTLLRPSAPFNL